MISGRLEKLYAGGYVEGWAFESLAPERPLVVDIRIGSGAVVAEGLANLYRDDLANARQGIGWCAFRLRLARPAAELRRGLIALHDKASGIRIDFAVEIPLVADDMAGPLAQDVVGFDPFVLDKISQLRACDDLLARFIRSRGPRAFVRAAYIYMLDRNADPESLELHAEMLRKGKLAPLQLLEIITDTTEYRLRPRELAAPNAPGFPFVEPAHA